MNKKKSLILFLTMIVLMTACSTEKEIKNTSSENASSGISTVETGEFISLVRLENEGREADVFSLKESEIVENAVFGYMDGLSVDVMLLERLADKQEKDYTKEYASIYKDNLNSLGYEIVDETIISQNHLVSLKRISYKGILDGKEKNGYYIIYAVKNTESTTVLYSINVPLSGLGEEGAEAFKDFCKLLEYYEK